ncbi:MAG: AAA family ATPase, partial [Bacteroidota bacterium]
METKTKERISTAVAMWLAKDHPDHSQNKLADVSGVNARYIQSIREGKTFILQKQEGKEDKQLPINDEHYYKLAKAIGINLQFTVHFDRDPNFNRIQYLCEFVQKTRRTGLIDSMDSGDGKTYGTEYYEKNHSNVIYIKVTHKMKGNDLIDHLIKILKIKIKEQRVSPAIKIQKIAEYCVGRPGLLIILDELEDCDRDIWRIIKDLTDALKSHCGIILCGLGLIEKFYDGAVKRIGLFPQLDRRYRANRVKLVQLTKPLIYDICCDNGISDRGAIRVLQKACEDRGMLAEYIK